MLYYLKYMNLYYRIAVVNSKHFDTSLKIMLFHEICNNLKTSHLFLVHNFIFYIRTLYLLPINTGKFN